MNTKEPYLYGSLFPEGEGGGVACYVNHFLNRYCPSPCGTGAVQTYLNQPNELPLSDILLYLSFHVGIISAGDILYYFGLPGVQVRRCIKELVGKGILLELTGVDSFRNKNYYVYTKKALLCGLSYEREHIIELNVRNLKERSLAHSYGISLSLLTMSLYCVTYPSYRFHYVLERSLGSMTSYNAKTGATVCADAIIYCSHHGKPCLSVYLEQDMDTERLSVLLDKLYQYFQTDIYQLSKKDSCCLLFSVYKCHYVNKNAGISYSKAHYIGLYLLFYIYLCEKYGDKEDGANIIFSFNLCEFYEKRCRILRKSLADKLFQDTEICNRSYFGVGWDKIVLAVQDLLDNGQDVLEEFLLCVGAIGYEKKPGLFSATLPVLQDYIQMYDDMEKGIKARICHSMPIIKAAKRRHFHFGRKLIDAFLDGSSPYLAPMCGGYRVYTMPSHLLTNEMPYILWDRESKEIQMLERYLSSCYGELVFYEKTSPLIPCSNKSSTFYNPYDICLRNYYQFDSIPKVCIEDISNDTSALLRSFLFVRYGHIGPEPVHLLLLVDSLEDALSFFTNYIYNPDSGMNLSRAADADVILHPANNENSLIRTDCSQIIFLQKRVSAITDNKLFYFRKDLTVIF